jgi:hypothetical protein
MHALADPFRGWRLAIMVASSLAALCHAGTARAELGGSRFSVQMDQARATGVLNTVSYIAYDRHEIVALDGATVHEFADRSGQVFAVTWRGRGPVDLQQLLGAHYAKFAAAGAAIHRDLHHTSVHLPDLVVDVSVVMNSWSGRAYLPQALPAGVSLRDIH